uniref:Uncharacterized protein n=1 Tax=Arundo donax TaxID=35708 RepID=A0A0A9DUN6_ARUDO
MQLFPLNKAAPRTRQTTTQKKKTLKKRTARPNKAVFYFTP